MLKKVKNAQKPFDLKKVISRKLPAFKGFDKQLLWFKEDVDKALNSQDKYHLLIFGRELKDAFTKPYFQYTLYNKKSGKYLMVASLDFQHYHLTPLIETFIPKSFKALNDERLCYDEDLRIFGISSNHHESINLLLNLGYNVNGKIPEDNPLSGNERKEHAIQRVKKLVSSFSDGNFNWVEPFVESLMRFKAEGKKEFVYISPISREMLDLSKKMGLVILYSKFYDPSDGTTYIVGFSRAFSFHHPWLYDLMRAALDKDLNIKEANIIGVQNEKYLVHSEDTARILSKNGFPTSTVPKNVSLTHAISDSED